VKILVPMKRVPDPELKAKIKDGKLDLSGAQWVVNTFDEYAVEAALRLTENADEGSREGEVVVVTIGPDEAGVQLRSCLAMGAYRAIHVNGEDAELDSLMVAKTLKAVYEQEKPDLIVMGKQAVDGDANQVGQMLAGLLNLPQATFAASIELVDDGKALMVSREVDAGVEFKKVPIPSLVTVDLRIVSPKAVTNHITPDAHEYADGPRYASLKGIMKAKKKPMDQKTFGDLGVTATAVVKELEVTLPESRAAGQMVESVAELVKKLHEEAKAL
jgi:electron transfer flavoprotein beta subunit